MRFEVDGRAGGVDKERHSGGTDGCQSWEEDHEESEGFQEGWSVSMGRTCLSRLLFLSILQFSLPTISLMQQQLFPLPVSCSRPGALQQSPSRGKGCAAGQQGQSHRFKAATADPHLLKQRQSMQSVIPPSAALISCNLCWRQHPYSGRKEM